MKAKYTNNSEIELKQIKRFLIEVIDDGEHIDMLGFSDLVLFAKLKQSDIKGYFKLTGKLRDRFYPEVVQ